MANLFSVAAMCGLVAALGTTPVRAELTPSQMEVATTEMKVRVPYWLANGNACPKIEIPASIVTTKKQFDQVDLAVANAKECVAEKRKKVNKDNILVWVKSRYKEASSTQLDLLAQRVLADGEALWASENTVVERQTENAADMVLPYMRRQEIELFIADERKECMAQEPKEREWSSFVASTMFLQGYALFDQCLNTLAHKIAAMDNSWIAKVYDDEAEYVKSYLRSELPGIRQQAIQELKAHMNATGPSRERAKRYDARARAAALAEREADEKE